MDKMRSIWLSANKLGYEVLKELVPYVKIDALLTLKKTSKTVMYDAEDRWDQLDIPIYRIDNINQEIELLKRLDPDLIVMCGWRQVINKEILEIPKKGIIGFHPTLLPFGRGPAPIINSILQGVKHSGVTMFYVDEGIDSGEIIAQSRFRINKKDHANQVYNKVIRAAKHIAMNQLFMLLKGKQVKTRKQDEKKAHYFPKLSLKNNEINLTDSIDDIYKKIRALSKPYNGAYIKKNGKKLIIWKAELQ